MFMLDLTLLRDGLEDAKRRLATRGFELDVETFRKLDGERRELIQQAESLRDR